METTNSELLSDISTLKVEIDDQIKLCENVSKLENVKSENLKDIISSTDDKIDKLKLYQSIILKRNSETVIKYKEESIKIKDLIKIKEGLLLKKQMKNILLNIASVSNDVIELSLVAFQDVQEYKKDLTVIYKVLNDFNNTKFKIEDYQ